MYTGLNKGCLPQKLLQVDGDFKPGDKHPNETGLVFIKFESRKSYPQRWGTQEQLDNKRKKDRIIAEKHNKRKSAEIKKRGAKRAVSLQTDYSRKFVRMDKHPILPDRYFISYTFCKRSGRTYERWKTLEQIEKHRLSQLAENKTEEQLARVSNQAKIYRLKNEKEIKLKKKIYYESVRHTDDYKQSRNEYNRTRRVEDECFRLRSLYTTRVRLAIKEQRGEKAHKTKELLGCTIEHVRDHLESQFTTGMTWDNMGKGGWHIDHIIPCAFFDLTKPSHQKVCFNWQNLQPLWEKDNCAKGDKIPLCVLLTILMNNYKTITL